MQSTAPLMPPDALTHAAALARQQQLTKPPGSLGRLEALACWLAACQQRAQPEPLRPAISIFAADHGIAAEGVSAYPASVTAAMVHNFAQGGAAINVLARQHQARLEVVDVGVNADLQGLVGIVQDKVAPGSANLLHQPALTRDQRDAAWATGERAAERHIAQGANLLIAGEMGIANTTAAACLICALSGLAPEQVVGRGTGLDDAGLLHKQTVVTRALQRAQTHRPATALDWLAQLGGLEIAAIAGFLACAARQGVPVVLDGFIVSAAALVCEAQQAGSRHWWLASHQSQETGHAMVLQQLGLTPLLDWQLRLGEGSGAALVLPLLQAAIALHNQMATFAEAGIPT
ncbi:nicotinate-nucleotide--dimethylbenzimidazole phosphoribosyltransferase [Leeia aquatica]|uniref:Nicotinate-nucleotide--dimethylbenzimidazole phosphoribosyltransferase n=1 Tax=Leeia aquatica TaxID=2725557 RepID=A0A847S8E0_9NEIS|nr:nicotinate-nucleotide--dimethylbenzimidazole phosphoribosyltransferase [Leeia aquatica]NLR75267.1 nicotinate-nucleotide--dimethylbenzimidazole phosphoribosyltransferase [Leeia aquatica]